LRTLKYYSIDELRAIFKSFQNFKNENPRQYQLEAAEFIINSDKPVVVLKADTGSGKTMIGSIVCKVYNNSTYLVHSKSLQNQAQHDFPEFEVLKGRANYECIDIKGNTVADCPYKSPKENCAMYWKCLYRVQKKKVVNHPLRLLNYQLFLNECNYVGEFSGSRLLICDEADTLKNELLNFIKLQVSEWQIAKFNIVPPKYKTACENGIKSWKDWAHINRIKVKKEYDKLDESAHERKIFEKYEGFMRRLGMFERFLDKNWIFQEWIGKFGRVWSFSPVWITPEMTDEFIRRHIGNENEQGKMVLMSAKLPPLPILSQETGIPMNEMDYMEVPSLFDPKKRPIYLKSTANMATKHGYKEFDKVASEINKILEEHAEQKGLIHTTNYRLRDLIMEHCNHNGRLITHELENRIEQIDKFKESDRPLVLVSPSCDRGISLDDELARFIIVTKLSYPDLGDKMVSAKAYTPHIGNYWYKAEAAQTLEQQCGRGIRSQDDYCTIYLLDTHIENIIVKHRELFSDYFLRCLIW